METIDLTPTWAAVLPILLAAMENGTDEGRRIAREEFARMARAADKHNEAAKAVSVAPWPDFCGQPITHGARLTHPDGTEFVAVRLHGFDDEGDAWRAVYDRDPQQVSRLCLQIGDKGRAVVTKPQE